MRHFGLAVAHVAAEQTVHRRRRLHVALDVGNRGGLVDGQLVGESVFEFLLPVCVGAEGVTGHGLALGVELQQLFGHVAHGLLDAGLRLLPCRAAQAIERRSRPAGVLLDKVQPLNRDEQLVLTRVSQLQELLLRVAGAANPELFQADELADAVVNVDDEVADFEVAQI